METDAIHYAQILPIYISKTTLISKMGRVEDQIDPLLLSLSLFIYFERERERVCSRSRDRGKERESQADSAL